MLRAQASRVRSWCVRVGWFVRHTHLVLGRRRRRFSLRFTAARRRRGGAVVVRLASRPRLASPLVLSPAAATAAPAPSPPPPTAVIIVVDVAPLSRSRRRPPHRRRPRDEPGPAATQDGCVSLTRGGQTGQPVDISGTCGYAIVRPVPEERDTGQEARGEFLLLSLDLPSLALLLSASFAIFFAFFFPFTDF